MGRYIDPTLKPAVYFATYLVDPNDAPAAMQQLREEVLSSFGQNDEQWSAIDYHDPGAVVQALSPSPLLFGLSLIIVTCPVEAPRGYWLSPLVLDVQSFDSMGKQELRGEPFEWGLRAPDGEPFVEPDEPYESEDDDARAYLQDLDAKRSYLFDHREED